MNHRRFVLGTLGAVILSCACADTTYRVQFAPDAQRSVRHISTLGVQRDGVMSRDGWRVLGPDQPAPFGGSLCDVGLSQHTFETAPEIAAALDAYVRSNGVSDRLIEQVAPAANGDTILYFTISGQARAPSSAGGGMQLGRAGGRGGRRGGGMGPQGRASQSQPAAHGGETGDGLQITAALFSVSERRVLGVLDMHYTGSSVGDALLSFRSRLESELPGAHCSGWDWSKLADASAIRNLPGE